jgi:hypothetical protein
MSAVEIICRGDGNYSPYEESPRSCKARVSELDGLIPLRRDHPHYACSCQLNNLVGKFKPSNLRVHGQVLAPIILLPCPIERPREHILYIYSASKSWRGASAGSCQNLRTAPTILDSNPSGHPASRHSRNIDAPYVAAPLLATAARPSTKGRNSWTPVSRLSRGKTIIAINRQLPIGRQGPNT